MRTLIWITTLTVAITACSNRPSTAIPDRHELSKNGFIQEQSAYPGTVLVKRSLLKNDRVWVFIESDGAAFGTWPTRKPAMPSVKRSVALGLTLQQTGGDVIYVARPCQFLLGETASAECNNPDLWTTQRFSHEAIELIEAVIKRSLGDKKRPVTLVGHSGGGTIALAIAQRKQFPVACVITLGSPIDLKSWYGLSGAVPPATAVDPANAISVGQIPPSIFMSGEHDQLVPPSAIGRWADVIRASSHLHHIRINSTHGTGWHNALTLVETQACIPKRTRSQ